MNDWSDAEKRVERAQQFFEQRKWSEAVEELRAAIEINPYNVAWIYNLGVALDHLLRFDEAVAAYRDALGIDPDDKQSLLKLGADLHRLGKPQQALRVLERLESVDATFEPSYCVRVAIHAETGNHDRAEEMFYTARQYKEECPDCYQHMGASLLARGKHERALYCYGRVLELDPERPGIHLLIARAHRASGDADQARRHYMTAFRLEPGNTTCLLELGDLLADTHRLDEAGDKYRRVLELAPDSASAHERLGRLHVIRGQYSAAIDELTRSIQLDPTQHGVHVRLAALHARTPDEQKMQKHLSAELSLRSEEPAVLLDLSNLLIDHGRLDEGIRCLKRLVHVMPESASAWLNLGVALYSAGQPQRGIDALHEALRRNPGNRLAIHNLILAYERLGRYDRAMAWSNTAQQVCPDDTDFARLRLRLRGLMIRQWASRALRGLLFWK